MTALDWLVLLLYGVIVFAIGAWALRRQKSGEDYFLGGRNLPWWAVGLSLLATSFSAASLVSGAQFGYLKGIGWLQLQIGDLLAAAVVAALFLPFFSSLRLTTAYEYVGRRFGGGARTAASLLFVAQTLARVAILVYVPATTLAAMAGWDETVCIVVTAVVAVTYSASGGMAAVVWTDTLQMLVVVVAIVASIALMAGDVDGGLGALLEHAGESGRLDAVAWPDSTYAGAKNLFTVVGAVIPYAVFAMSLFGTGQQAVQRYLSCRDLAGARRAAFTGPVVGTVVLGLSLLLGTLLASWSDLTGTTLATSEGAADVLPVFVLARLPAGLRGLLLAAVFAAAMSSVDSAVHSMSTAVLVDFVRPLRRRRRGNTVDSAADSAAELGLGRVLTVVFGALAVGGALLARSQGATILETLVTWLGYAAGPLLGLFLLGMLNTRANQPGALTGVAAGCCLVVAVTLFPPAEGWGFHPLWVVPFACAVTWLVGRLVSAAFPAPSAVQLDGLTWITRPTSRTGSR